MTRIARTSKSIAAAAVAALALVTGATAADIAAPQPGIPAAGGITAGTGCSISCIVSALVTPTASSASVMVKTSVPTSATVTVTELHPTLGLAAGTTPKHTLLPAFASVRTVSFVGLQPETTYRISVSARDAQGRVETRSGTFTTRKVRVAVSQPATGLATTVNCGGDCITAGSAAAHATEAGRVDFTIRTTVPSSMRLEIYRRDGDVLRLERTVGSSTGLTAWSPAVRGLRTGTRFDVSLTVTDEQGRARREWGAIRTARAVAIVTFHKHKVLADGEVGRGEISFDYTVESVYRSGNGFHKRSSGDTFAAVGWGTSRETVTIETSIDGHSRLDLAVRGVECDGASMKNCVVEAGRMTTGEYAGDMYVIASSSSDLRSLLAPDGALPPDYGTGLPAGHDAYLVWEAGNSELKFRTYATVDFEVVS